MAFTFDNKQYSDQEVASAVKQLKQQRRQWCEQEVCKYLSTHARNKFYFTEFYIPDTYDSTYIMWKQSVIDTIKNELSKYGPYEDEDAECDERLNIIEDLSANGELDLSGYIPEIEMYESHHVIDIDINKYICSEKACVLRFDKETDKPTTTYCNVELTDEEYIQVMTELLYSPSPLSFDGILHLLPEIGMKIYNQCTNNNQTSAIFLTELNNHVDEILAQHGGREKTPHVGVFSNIFAQIAEHIAK